MKKMYVLGAMLGLMYPAAGLAGETAKQAEVPTMEEVVITATKSQEKRKEIPNSVVIKDSFDIEESSAKSVGELVANEPGIDLRTRGNYGGASEEIHLRGLGADGTQVMVNGVVLNSPSFGSADVSQIPLNNIDRVEVVKGPGSVLYGSGAMGGTVSVITKRPERDMMTAAAEAGYGTESTYRLSAEQGMFVCKDFGYYLTASRMETDGFRDNSDLEHTDASLNLVYNKGDKLDISLYGDYVNRDYGVPGPKPPEGTQDYFIGSTKMYNSESANLADHGSDENYHSTLAVKGKALDWLDLRMKADYSILESDNYSKSSFSGSGTETIVTNTIKGIEANAHMVPASWLKGIVGTEYRDFDYENEQQGFDANDNAIAGSTSKDEHAIHTHGTFAELQVSPVKMVKLFAGVRYEDHSRFGNETIPRLGIVVNPLESTTLKVNHSKHFKAPTMNDLFWPDSGFAKGNPDLKPETGWHTDVTVEQGMFKDLAFVSVSYFQWDLNDKIDWAENPDEPTGMGWNYWTPSNISAYQAKGIELGAGFGPYEGVRADLSLTYQDVEEELVPGTKRQARYKPETLFKFSLTHTADFGLTSNMTARYVGERPGYYALKTDETPEEALDAYWTVDLKFIQNLTENWRVLLTVSNLLDEEYATFLAGFTDQTTYTTTQQPYPGAGRSVFASVKYEF